MDEWLRVARATGCRTHSLWIGPTAPGHPAEHGTGLADQRAWQYTFDTAGAARDRRMDVLNLYNATVQATSWDGTHFGERVSLVQAMMVCAALVIFCLGHACMFRQALT